MNLHESPSIQFLFGTEIAFHGNIIINLLKENFMKSNFLGLISAIGFAMACAAPASATVVDFSGGTTSVLANGIQYDQAGLRMTANGQGASVSNYYGGNNSVMHTHPQTGSYGTTTLIKGVKIDGSAFQLDQLLITSDTATGGGNASGQEQAFLHASIDGVTSSFSIMLPPENWGLPGTTVVLGTEFDNIKAFWITFANDIDCFGLDDVMFSQAVVSADVPEPGSLALLGLGIAGLFARRRKA
jgi:hypothetical protein